MKLTIALLTLTGFSIGAENRTEIPLWSDGAPGSEGQTGKERIEPPAAERTFIRVSNIHKPSITVYRPKPGTATGAAIIVAPGGGHRMLAMHEGYDVAEWLAGKGAPHSS